MKRKIFSVLAVLVLVLSFSLMTAVPVAATDGVWYVDDSADAGGDGSLESPFLTIGEAITAAGTDDIINVAAGTYDERVVISNQLTLLGAQHGEDPTVADARTTEADESVIESGVKINAYDVVLDGFTVRTIGTHVVDDYGIDSAYYGTTADGATILNNIVEGPSYRGMFFDRSAQYSATGPGYTVSNNLIKDCDMAIEWRWVRDSTLSGNKVTGCGVGIQLQSAVKDSTISRNTVTANDGNGILIGGLFAIFRTSISENTITANGGKGILIKTWDATSTINNNNISGNNEYGLENLSDVEVDATNNWWGSTDETEIAAMVSGLVDYDPWLDSPVANIVVGLTGVVEQITAINVGPGSIDFGTIIPGTPVSGDDIYVENIGTVLVDVSAALDKSGTVFEYLELADVSYDEWGIIGLAGGTTAAKVTTLLDVPSDYSAKGVETNTLIFTVRTY